MVAPRISLDQWRALVAVVEAGGYAQAAARLHRSQSSVTYAVQKIERLLGLKVFELRGRRAALTEAGQVLYRRAKTLIEDAEALERGAAGMAADWSPEIRLAVEVIFPTWLLLECFARFAETRPQTRIQLHETVLGGTDEALAGGAMDLAITSHVPAGLLGDPLIRLRVVPAAHPDHPLHRLGRTLTQRDLRRHRQLVVRDSGVSRAREVAWLGAEQRWTVTSKATSIRAACMGLGFAWYPEDGIREELAAGRLKPLPLREGGERFEQLYMVYTDRDYPGRDTVHLAEIIRERVHVECARRERDESGQPAASGSAAGPFSSR